MALIAIELMYHYRCKIFARLAVSKPFLAPLTAETFIALQV